MAYIVHETEIVIAVRTPKLSSNDGGPYGSLIQVISGPLSG